MNESHNRKTQYSDQYGEIEQDMDNINMNEEEEEEKERFFGKDIYLFLFLLLVLIVGLSTVSFAFYREYFGDGTGGTGTNLPSNNTITTGDVLFTYSDSGRGTGGNGSGSGSGNGSGSGSSGSGSGSGSGESGVRGNGIYITNATPIPDDEGKRLLSSRDYFDFQIMVNPAKGDVTYQVILEKADGCTLPDSDVKVYLTELQGTEEVPIADTMNGRSVKLYSQLEDKDFDDFQGKVLLQRIVTEKGYQKNYRLRLWVRDQARDYSRKSFSVKVDIHAFTQAK